MTLARAKVDASGSFCKCSHDKPINAVHAKPHPLFVDIHRQIAAILSDDFVRRKNGQAASVSSSIELPLRQDLMLIASIYQLSISARNESKLEYPKMALRKIRREIRRQVVIVDGV